MKSKMYRSRTSAREIPTPSFAPANTSHPGLHASICSFRSSKYTTSSLDSRISDTQLGDRVAICVLRHLSLISLLPLPSVLRSITQPHIQRTSHFGLNGRRSLVALPAAGLHYT